MNSQPAQHIDELRKYCRPTSNAELFDLISTGISVLGPNADLNYIDTSGVDDMSKLFRHQNYQFNGDISKWDVSKCRTMMGMFQDSCFDGDISQWDVGACQDFRHMFSNTRFNGDLSSWRPARCLGNMLRSGHMFSRSSFTGDLRNWLPTSTRQIVRQSVLVVLFGPDYHRYLSARDMIETRDALFTLTAQSLETTQRRISAMTL